MKTFWISFCSNETGKNLGVCIVDGEDKTTALSRTTELGINPGGEAVLCEGPTEREINKYGKDRLISREELIGDGYIPTNNLPSCVVSILMAHPAVSIARQTPNPTRDS